MVLCQKGLRRRHVRGALKPGVGVENKKAAEKHRVKSLKSIPK
jgi:hypothetical protein